MHEAAIFVVNLGRLVVWHNSEVPDNAKRDRYDLVAIE
jgi:hypothetical protein